MNRQKSLSALRELLSEYERLGTFKSKRACLDWASRVAVFLQIDPNLYQNFTHHLAVLSHTVSSWTAQPAFDSMLNIIRTAITALESLSNDELQMDTPGNQNSRPSMIAQKENQIFISHIGEEAPLASALKNLLRSLFKDTPVFVSSDYESLRSGQEWYDAIVQSARS